MAFRSRTTALLSKRSPTPRLYRHVTSTIKFTAIDNEPSAHQKGMVLRVPLLKSPSHFGHFTSRVSRLYNEDRYCAGVLEVPGEKAVFNFSVFDGHGGHECAQYLSESLLEEVEQGDNLIGPKDKYRNELIKNYAKNVGGYWKRWYRERKKNFAAIADNTSPIKLSGIERKEDDWHFRLPLTFLNADYNYFLAGQSKSGSTCTSVFIETLYSEDPAKALFAEQYYFNSGTISRLTVAHVGDTRAILVDASGEAHGLTQPHHPSNPVESTRLRRYAAAFMVDSFGEERFVALANTRAFGDIDFKQLGVTAEPDVSQYIIGDADTIHKKLTPEEIANYTLMGLGGNESFLVLCSDGITGEITDQEIADIVISNYNMKGQPHGSPQQCAEEVVKYVEYIGGSDNATCLVIRLNGWGKWPEMDRTGELRQRRMDDYNPRSRE